MASNAAQQFDTGPPKRIPNTLAAIVRSFSYSRVQVGGSDGDDFSSEPFEAILPASVDGDLAIIDGEGNEVTIPSGAMTAGEVLPIEVSGIQSSGTTQTLGDLLFLRK